MGGKSDDFLNKSKPQEKAMKFVCVLCLKSFPTRRSRESHLGTHKEQVGMLKESNGNEKKFPCPICGALFSREVSVRQHTRKVHETAKTKQCRFCVVKFKSDTERRSHEIRRRGQGEGTKKCPDCGKKFVRKEELKLHKAKIHDKLSPFNCERCGEGFFSKGNFNAHKLFHLGILKYVCEICEIGFMFRSSLKKHIKKMHGEREEGSSSEVKNTDETN